MRKNGKKFSSRAIEAKASTRTNELLTKIELSKPKPDQTLAEFVCNTWWPTWALKHLQPASIASYRTQLEQRILPVFGHFMLREIRPIMLSRFYAALSEPGMRNDGGTLSYATIKKVETVLSSILSSAESWELIDYNPCRKVSPDRLDVDLVDEYDADDKDDKEEGAEHLTVDQTLRLFDFIANPYKCLVRGHTRRDDTGITYQVRDYFITKTVPLQMQVLIYLAVFTGARKGELLALQWPDIDFEHNSVSITKALSRVDGQNIIKKPKSDASNRTVSIPEMMAQHLVDLRAWQDQQRKKKGDDWNAQGWLFTKANGSIMGYHTPYETLRRLINRHNECHPEGPELPVICFHALRHTCATFLISHRQDVKTVAARLGHADPSVTLKTYAHAVQENNENAADMLEAILEPHKAS